MSTLFFQSTLLWYWRHNPVMTPADRWLIDKTIILETDIIISPTLIDKTIMLGFHIKIPFTLIGKTTVLLG